MPKNRRRALVTFHETAERQLAALTDDDLARLDTAVDAIAADPAIGRPLADSPLREHQQDSVRVIYYATTLGTIIVVAYVEV